MRLPRKLLAFLGLGSWWPARPDRTREYQQRVNATTHRAANPDLWRRVDSIDAELDAYRPRRRKGGSGAC